MGSACSRSAAASRGTGWPHERGCAVDRASPGADAGAAGTAAGGGPACRAGARSLPRRTAGRRTDPTSGRPLGDGRLCGGGSGSVATDRRKPLRRAVRQGAGRRPVRPHLDRRDHARRGGPCADPGRCRNRGRPGACTRGAARRQAHPPQGVRVRAGRLSPSGGSPDRRRATRADPLCRARHRHGPWRPDHCGVRQRRRAGERTKRLRGAPDPRQQRSDVGRAGREPALHRASGPALARPPRRDRRRAGGARRCRPAGADRRGLGRRS